MTSQKKFYILGSGWVSTLGNGLSGSQPRFSIADVDFQYPELEGLISGLPSRYGRFDVYTKVCFSTAVLALHDAGLLQGQGKRDMGIVVGSHSGVYDNDMAFYKTTLEAGGEFSSPNLFSYTLPNVALGEIAVFFQLTGPSFCVGNDPNNPGLAALNAGLSLLDSKQCTHILVGWAETTQSITKFSKGAAFAVLTLEPTGNFKAEYLTNQGLGFLELFEG
jgi:3-oxoacyl-(acyl-carrier-protein) synthase